MNSSTTPNSSALPFAASTLPLALAQTIFWASTFYLLPALILSLERAEGWSKTEISAAMTGAILMSAICARPVGRAIDRGHGRTLMSMGAVISAFLLLCSSWTTSFVVFAFCWLGIGSCMAAMLYEPCFSIITRHYGTGARSVITHITLIAGFAGTLAFPLATWLSTLQDWRLATQVFAALIFLVGLPLAWLAITRLENRHPVVSTEAAIGQLASTPPKIFFWLIAGAFTLGSINHTMVISHLLPLISERGLPTQTAVIAAMLIGPMQVVGRLLLMTNEKRISTRAGGFICFLGLSFSTLLLLGAGTTSALIFLAASLHGATWGLVSITRPTLVRETLGQAGFGATSGAVAAITILGIASAPTLGAILWNIGGYQLMLTMGCTMAFTGSFLLWLLIAMSKKMPQTGNH